MGDLSNFQKGEIMGACLAGASVTLTDQLFGVLCYCLVFHSLYDYDCMNNGRKPKVNNRDCQTLRRIVSAQNNCHKMTAHLNIHLEDPVSTKTTTENFTKPSPDLNTTKPLWASAAGSRCTP
uniref:Uncharacterized protein n=1 Tax=Sinocyclocheilus grahami TaxID=75366 RepID=A0A672K2J9_SINGR